MEKLFNNHKLHIPIYREILLSLTSHKNSCAISKELRLFNLFISSLEENNLIAFSNLEPLIYDLIPRLVKTFKNS